VAEQELAAAAILGQNNARKGEVEIVGRGGATTNEDESRDRNGTIYLPQPQPDFYEITSVS
jgi:hypothetical protein